jgi:hypothetical protein
MISKKGDFNFVWLFAIIAGTAFLILAIFFAVKLGGTFKTAGDVSIAKSIESITDPLQAGFTDSKVTLISFQLNSQIIPSCYDTGFGYHMLAVVTESDALKNNPPTPVEIKIPNKYIFAQEDFGKDYYVFSKKFEAGFSVADLLFISTKNYCLLNPPQRIKEEILRLDPKNIGVRDAQNDSCSQDNIRVCFGYGEDCNMTISGNCFDNKYCEDPYETGFIQKGTQSLGFSGNLIYGAIFSDQHLYECNVKRLLYRTSQIAEVYHEKANLMDARGCNTLLNTDLTSLSQITVNATSQDLPVLFKIGKQLANKEDKEACGLW